jgi:hypothetical protein
MTLHCFVVDHHEHSPVQIHGTGARCGLRRWPDRRVGITAAASAPPHLVNQLADACLDSAESVCAKPWWCTTTSNSASHGSWDE